MAILPYVDGRSTRHFCSARETAELSGELIASEKRILQLREDISSLDRTIRVFDPTAQPHTTRPILRRKLAQRILRKTVSASSSDMRATDANVSVLRGRRGENAET